MKKILTVLTFLSIISLGTIQAPFAQDSIKDAEILSIMATIDRNEIQAAQDAVNKKNNQEITDFANLLYSEHTKNLRTVTKLAYQFKLALPETSTVQALKAKGLEDLTILRPLNGDLYDRTYITTTITGHNEALDIIDNKLAPNARTPAIKAHVADLRTHVAMHLETARKIQDKQPK